ncbi:hypothetical protein JHK82_024800 [Glycine max]|nr:hypothetical protein JHK86_024915 [Glycine max]KAG5133612.1 hypothetical protein JHK82_024800 [Glycine max]KAH1233120.1 B3 domain-containing transcription factor VRN1 [Glycine max]
MTKLKKKHPLPSEILFFKIISEASLQDGKLKIPNKFTREYGVNLSNPVFLKPPDGIEWKIFWTKHDGDIWFQKGWKEFATYYSLSHKYLVLFKYQETSHLEVHIFDQSALEVDYPFCGIKIEHENLDHVSNDSVEVSDDSIEVLDELTPSQKKTRLKSTSCSRPRKKLNTGPSEVFEESSNLPQHVQIKGEQSQGTNLGMSSDKQVLDGMAPEQPPAKRQKKDQSSSQSAHRTEYPTKFRTVTHEQRYETEIKMRNFIPEKNFKLKPGEYDEIQKVITWRKWEKLCSFAQNFHPQIVREFYANAYGIEGDTTPLHTSWVRGKMVSYEEETINSFFGTQAAADCSYKAGGDLVKDYGEMKKLLARPGAIWIGKKVKPRCLRSIDLYPVVHAWSSWMHHTVLPCANESNVTVVRSQFLIATILNEPLDIGRIISSDIHQVAQTNKPKATLSHPSLICFLCERAGVGIPWDEPTATIPRPITAAWIDSRLDGPMGAPPQPQEQQPQPQPQQEQEQHAQEDQPPAPSSLDQCLMLLVQTQTQLSQDIHRLVTEARVQSRGTNALCRLLALQFRSQQQQELLKPQGQLTEADILQMVGLEKPAKPSSWHPAKVPTADGAGEDLQDEDLIYPSSSQPI